jgi:TonB family protein
LDDGLHNFHFTDERDAVRPRAHLAAFCASIAAHAALIAAIVFFAGPIPQPSGDRVLAYLIEVGDGSAGSRSTGSRGEKAGATAPAAASIRAAAASMNARIGEKPRASASATSRARAVRAVVHEVEPTGAEVASIAPVAASSAARATRASLAASNDGVEGPPPHPGVASPGSNGSISTGAGDAGNGAGNENQSGDGTSIAHADYARHPLPAYPTAARRRAEQGVVTIRVLVGDDGSVERAELAESSGYDALDEAALGTVRARWRFIPARRAGVAIESWVLVPIRFALTQASAAR